VAGAPGGRRHAHAAPGRARRSVAQRPGPAGHGGRQHGDPQPGPQRACGLAPPRPPGAPGAGRADQPGEAGLRGLPGHHRPAVLVDPGRHHGPHHLVLRHVPQTRPAAGPGSCSTRPA
jgi:hypothetical protein